MAKLADALVLGTSANGVEVRVLSSAPQENNFLLNNIKTNQIYFLIGFLYYSEYKIIRIINTTIIIQGIPTTTKLNKCFILYINKTIKELDKKRKK